MELINRCPCCGQQIEVKEVNHLLSLKDIADTVCGYANMEFDSLIGRVKTTCGRELDNNRSLTKHIIYFIAYCYTKYPIQTIGKMFNNKHCSVLYGVESIDQEIRINYDVRIAVNDILGILHDKGFYIMNQKRRAQRRDYFHNRQLQIA